MTRPRQASCRESGKRAGKEADAEAEEEGPWSSGGGGGSGRAISSTADQWRRTEPFEFVIFLLFPEA